MDKIPFYTGFQGDLTPIVYQIEVTNRCNLSCPKCYRKDTPQVPRDLTVDDLERIIENGWLDRTSYVELQMAGEPTLNPFLAEIVRRIRALGVLVGFSTNLTTATAPVLAMPDSITISCDSMDSLAYERSRVPHLFSAFLANLKHFLRTKRTTQFVQLQTLNTDLTQDSGGSLRSRLEEFLDGTTINGPRPLVREVPDCFYGITPPDRSLCLNPFLTVSIRANGDVTSCCYDFGSQNKIGNAIQNPFSDMRVDFVRHQKVHYDGSGLTDVCRRCYIKSPILFYFSMVSELLKFRSGLGLS